MHLTLCFCGYCQSTSSAILILNNRLSTHVFSTSQQTYSIRSLNYYSKKKSSLKDLNSFCTNKGTTINDFRAKEEQKDREFQEKQREKGNEDSDKSDDTKSEEEFKLNSIREKILEASLPFVATHGWSRKAIAEGAEKVGYPGGVHGMFAKGAGIELIGYFYGQCNKELVEIMKNETKNGQFEIKNSTDFLVRCVKLRLKMIEPYIASWPQALAMMSLPQNVPSSLAQLLTLVDDICYFCGDRSIDFGWYTRRVGLAAVFKMTELYMLQDSSVDHQKTWEFLKNRIDEAKLVEKFLGKTNVPNTDIQKKLRATFDTARNILGLDYNRQ